MFLRVTDEPLTIYEMLKKRVNLSNPNMQDIISKEEEINKFQWSLKPLTSCLQFFGIPLNVSGRPRRTFRIFVTLLGFCIILINLIINGPRGFEPGSLKWMESIQDFDSPYTYFKANSFGLIRLVKIVSQAFLFCYVPFLHLVFVCMILFGSNWAELIVILQKIQQTMKLNEEFHRKLFKKCIATLCLLAVVGYIHNI